MPAHLASIQDVEAIARRKLNKWNIDYYFFPDGTNRHQTYSDCSEAFKRYRLRPRILRDVSRQDLSTSLLGRSISFPVCISPSASQVYAHQDKEIASAKAAADSGTCMVLSSCASTRLEDVAQASSSGLLWLQIYMFTDRHITKALVRAAEKAGYKALVVTVDSCLEARGKTSISHIHILEDSSFPNFLRVLEPEEKDDLDYVLGILEGYGSTLRELKWLRSFTKLPVVLKGILTGKTAKLAVSKGVADGIIVSAHGGRQLDGGPATIDALSEVVQAVKGSGVEVYLDGGVRTGTDVLKALARGARAVFLGRPVLWGLCAGGQEGVKRVLDIYRDELKLAMALTGCNRIEDISPELLMHESHYLASKL